MICKIPRVGCDGVMGEQRHGTAGSAEARLRRDSWVMRRRRTVHGSDQLGRVGLVLFYLGDQKQFYGCMGEGFRYTKR